jgi:hypothetical protein
MTRFPISPAEREGLITQATAAAHCWFVVCAGAALTVFAHLLPI